MTSEIVLILAQDGLVNGAIYALLALALILVFTVTRVIYVPQGEFVTYGALTFAALQRGYVPGVVLFLIITGLIAAAMEIRRATLQSSPSRSLFSASLYAGYPLVLGMTLYYITGAPKSVAMQVLVTLAIVAPLGPILWRIVFQPMATANVLVLLIAAVALHLVLTGVGLLAFGPDGARTEPLLDVGVNFGVISIPAQSIATIAASLMLIVMLFWAFTFTLRGKALRATAVNSVGARLVGVRPEMSATVCFFLAGLVGAVSGVLISAITTIYYDTGLLIALKGFIGAIIGALVSYPLGAIGAIAVGLIESFSSFWASAFKEALLFGLIIPVLLWLSVTRPMKDEHE